MADLRNKGHQGLNLLVAVDAAQRIACGDITSKQLVLDCLQRIEDRDTEIGAWKFIDPDYAIEQANECDDGLRSGPLFGVPIGIKDNFDTKDMPTEYGTSIYSAHQPTADTLTVENLRKAGAQIIEVSLPEPFKHVMERSFDVIRMREYLVVHDFEIRNHFEIFNPWFQDAVKQARSYSEADFEEALEEAAAVRSLLAEIFSSLDILLTPSALGIATSDLFLIEPNNFNYLWTLMYTPCINLPAFKGPYGLPVGLQVIGPRNADRKTLEYAHWLDNSVKMIAGEYPVDLVKSVRA